MQGPYAQGGQSCGMQRRAARCLGRMAAGCAPCCNDLLQKALRMRQQRSHQPGRAHGTALAARCSGSAAAGAPPAWSSPTPAMSMAKAEQGWQQGDWRNVIKAAVQERVHLQPGAEPSLGAQGRAAVPKHVRTSEQRGAVRSSARRRQAAAQQAHILEKREQARDGGSGGGPRLHALQQKRNPAGNTRR